MQRLYSTFANGFPGKGLVILRLAVSMFLLYACLEYNIVERVQPHVAILAAAAAFGGLFLLGGLWTPLAGTIVGMLELWIAFVRPADWRESVLAAAIVVALALLGPGAWSIDAQIYGRKRISVHDRLQDR